MVAIQFNIINCNDESNFIEQKLDNYSHALHFVYKKLEESSDKSLQDYCFNRWNINHTEWTSIKSLADQMFKSLQASKKRTEGKLEELDEGYSKLLSKIENYKNKVNPSPKQIKKLKNLKKQRIKLEKKIAYKKQSLKKDMVFGNKSLFRRLCFLNNDKVNNVDVISETKIKYQNKRLGAIYLMGEANQKGNRFFDFSRLNEHKISYKPKRGVKIEFDVCKRKDKNIEKIIELTASKVLPVTVSITKDTVTLMYDEAIINGYKFDGNAARKEANEKTKSIFDKDLKSKIAKEIYREHHIELVNKMLIGKKENRYMGIDINPEHIAYSIVDKLNDGEIKVIESGNYNFKHLCKKSKKASDSNKTKYFNNKRKHERKEVICDIFKKMTHYKVAYFVIEELEFKDKKDNEGKKEFNRKVKNIWDRELLTTIIKKKCTEGGFQLIEINPVYTSLIGNLQYCVFDPVAASLEITRRGCYKYDKGFFYPVNNCVTPHATELAAHRAKIDVEVIKTSSWKEIQTIFNKNKYRYRWGEKVGRTSSLSLKSYRSKVLLSLYSI